METLQPLALQSLRSTNLAILYYVEISAKDKKLEAETVFGTVEAVKTVSDLFLPVAGIITEVNPMLESEPEKVNSDPYGDGWMVKMKMDNPGDINQLMDADAYQEMVS